MTDLSSEELFRMATEKVFTSMKGLSEAKQMIADSRKRADDETEVPGGGMKEEIGGAVKEAMSALTSIYGGDNLTQTITQCIRNLAIELVDLGGVEIQFEGVKVKLEHLPPPSPPQAVGFPNG